MSIPVVQKVLRGTACSKSYADSKKQPVPTVASSGSKHLLVACTSTTPPCLDEQSFRHDNSKETVLCKRGHVEGTIAQG